ncbi:myo-inositol 2-dehydrogenase [Aquipluma nitroreducens]|uniref:Myo-inositol 2-dehydrogenase n=1 Tax=Aquipluma nitroreducens TaxID=2010828 RepID=A0A5K7SF38_9BACT|nr:Gfo/Idh/MocA family oxidoreductase [Aquipluma nitroreducens]BBE20210.1 myo-inositol 2-dehydrogenase [Aquipluma nitroreducens]
MESNRRDFIKKTLVGVTALSAGGILPGFSVRSYNRILGSNEKIRISVMGVNSRGKALAETYASQPNCDVIHICDVDRRAMEKCIASVTEIQQHQPKGLSDFRRSLESKDIDGMVIATPDHWHAPAAILSMQAGKHVYVEKPCSHNPAEGELLIKAADKCGKVIQMGNQRRSYPNVIKAIQELRNGAIGRSYLGKGWYTNNRGPIGIGKEVDVPEWLDWDLWQGPAPRKAYKDNIVHYNWHWRWHWGTGEALNNGTHMVDLLRWGLDVDFPTKVSSAGGRYRYKDDWETPDTQIINFEFGYNIAMTWEGRSCNGKTIEGSTVGALFYGENGSLMIDGNAYTIFDLESKVVKVVKNEEVIDARNLSNPASDLDSLHIQNFFSSIKTGEKLNSDIDSGHKSTLLVQLGNISQRVGHSLNIDPKTGHILDDKDAMQFWQRSYEKGWEIKL